MLTPVCREGYGLGEEHSLVCRGAGCRPKPRIGDGVRHGWGSRHQLLCLIRAYNSESFKNSIFQPSLPGYIKVNL